MQMLLKRLYDLEQMRVEKLYNLEQMRVEKKNKAFAYNH